MSGAGCGGAEAEAEAVHARAGVSENFEDRLSVFVTAPRG